MPIKILVVDDHALYRRGIMALLKDFYPDYQIDEAEDGVKGIIKARELKPEIILLDYHMPKLNGVKAATLIRKASKTSKIIAVSMEMNPDVMIEMINIGVVGIISKNDYDTELKMAIEHVKSGERHIPEKVSQIISQKVTQDKDSEKKKRHNLNELLSDREMEVFHLVVQGYSIERIAESLAISERTVSNHKASIYKKCKVKNNSGLIRYAIKTKMINYP